MAVAPDVYQVHQHDTERYVLTNLNMVSEVGLSSDRREAAVSWEVCRVFLFFFGGDLSSSAQGT